MDPEPIRPRQKIRPMLIVLALLVAWFAVNIGLLGAAAVANHRGQQAARRVVAQGTPAPVVALVR